MSESKKKIFIPLLILMVVVLLGSFSFLLNGKLNIGNTKKLVASTKPAVIGNTSTQKLNNDFEYIPPFDSYSRSLQGISVSKDYIYFSTSTASCNSTIRAYSKKDKQVKVFNSKSSSINKINRRFIRKQCDAKKPATNSSVYANYKINDITRNKKNYFMAYYYPDLKAGEKRTSKILFFENDILREVNMNHGFVNLAYNTSNDKFYTMTKNAIYELKIPEIKKSDNRTNLGTIEPTKKCGIEMGNKNVSLQGIAFRSSSLLLSSYIVMKDNVISNYIDVFNLKNCKNKKGYRLKPVHTIKLGSCLVDGTNEIENCELESLYFSDSKLYLGYSNSNSNKTMSISNYKKYPKRVTVYTLDMINNSFKTALKVKSINGNKITLKGAARSNDLEIYSYKFCKNKYGKDCYYKNFRDKKTGKVLNENYAEIEFTTSEINSDWYFFAKDIFGNVSSVKLTKEEIAKALNNK